MPKVSVIVPNYNHARFLACRLDSIIGQTFTDFEVIILDDASTDGSAQVIADFSKKWPARVIMNEHNTGNPFKQWNRGVGESQGEFIWIAETDDNANPDLLERLVSVLEANPNVGLAYCQSDRIDENGVRIGSLADWTADIDVTRWQTDFIGPGIKECAEALIIKNTIPNASAVVFRREVFERAGGATDTMRLCGDWMTWVSMLLISDVAFVSASLNRFRAHPNSVRETCSLPQYCEEEYRVKSFILEHVAVKKDLRQRAADDAWQKWISAMTSKPQDCCLSWLVRILCSVRVLKSPAARTVCMEYLRYKVVRRRATGLLSSHSP